MAASAQNIIAFFAVFVSFLALEVPSCIDQRGTSTPSGTASASASAPPPFFDDGALKAVVAMLALAGMDAVLIAAAVIYSRHTHHTAVPVGAGGGGGGNWRVAFFVLCLQVGVLQLVPFVQEPAAAGAIVISAAAHALPCVASVTFFVGITLIYAHVGNGGGGAAGRAVAGNGPAPVPATVRLLADVTLGAALACLMSIILALFYNNTK